MIVSPTFSLSSVALFLEDTPTATPTMTRDATKAQPMMIANYPKIKAI